LSYDVNKNINFYNCENYDELLEHINVVCAKIKENPNKSFSLNKKAHYSCEKIDGKIAYLFPGQGSQYTNMTGELSMFLIML